MTTNHNEEPLIQVKNLGKSFGSISVLSGIDLDIYKGDVVFVVGPSGSGKSTFLPVSYTHLDVYKRQSLDGPGSQGAGREPREKKEMIFVYTN